MATQEKLRPPRQLPLLSCPPLPAAIGTLEQSPGRGPYLHRCPQETHHPGTHAAGGMLGMREGEGTPNLRYRKSAFYSIEIRSVRTQQCLCPVDTREEAETGEIAMSLNKVMLIGYLGQDPKLRHLPTSGQAATTFSLATDESFTAKDSNRHERVEWHNVVVFGRLAEICTKYLAKGRQIYVEGRLRTREFDSKNEGGKRQRAEIVAQRTQFLGPRPEAPVGGEAEEPAGTEETPF
jgi:single-strand DNA-binding protein